jgi:transcriptional regulator with XRE-family HTH domain
MVSSFASYDMPKRQPKPKKDVPPSQGPALEARRKQLKMTQPELGFLINVSQPSISEYERNVRPVTELTMDRLTAYATGLKWSVSQLLEATGMKSDSSTQFFASDLTSPKVLDVDNSSSQNQHRGEFVMVQGIAHANMPASPENPTTPGFSISHPIRADLEIWECNGSIKRLVTGDHLMVYTSEKTPVIGRLYVFKTTDGNVGVWQAVNIGGTIWLASENLEHSTEWNSVQIIGLVAKRRPSEEDA